MYVRPRIGSKSIYDLKRKDIVEMLDAIEDADKAPTADRVLAYVRKASTGTPPATTNSCPRS